MATSTPAPVSRKARTSATQRLLRYVGPAEAAGRTGLVTRENDLVELLKSSTAEAVVTERDTVRIDLAALAAPAVSCGYQRLEILEVGQI